MPSWLVELLSNPNAKEIGVFLSGLALMFWKGILPALSKYVTHRFLKSDPGPVSPMPLPAPAPEPVQVPARVVEQVIPDLGEAARIMAEWSMDEARRRVRELQDEVALVRREKRQVEYQLEDAMRDNQRTSTALGMANAEVDRLQAELVKADRDVQAEKARAAQAWRALAEYKKEVSSGFQGSTVVTPLRPPRGQR